MRGLLSSQLNRGTGLLNMNLNQPDYEALMRGVDQAVAARPQAPAQPQRKRVSGWRVLDRVLGGETITGGLDAERARLEAEALKPQRQAMQQEALSAITNPRERALFLGIGGEEWRKNVGEQFAPQVIAAGGVQRIAATGDAFGANTSREHGDRIAITNPITGETTYTDARPMTHAETTARFNAENPTVSANSRVVNLPTGKVVAEGFIAPEVTNTPQGGTTNVIDPRSGRVINSIQGNPEAPTSAKQTEGERKDGFNANRMSGSSQTINALEDSGFDPTLRGVTGLFDQNARAYQAAAEEWADAMLRLTSGAQAPQSEIEAQVRTYFPQPGDGPQVRAQKRSARERVERDALARGGGEQAAGQSQGQPSRAALLAEARRRGLL